MSFLIQISNPTVKTLSRRERYTESLCAAVQRAFSLTTERAFLIWNGLYIPIDYKYELSIILDDLIPFLSHFIKSDSGSYKVEFGVDSFRAIWGIHWGQEKIKINS